MTLGQLKILSHIVELGSLKQAALALHKTQPALSMAIKKLEAEFGFDILDRSQYRLKLSPQGKTFYRQAQLLLADAEQVNSLGHQLAQGNEAKLHISYEEVCPKSLFMGSILQLSRQFCSTELHINAGARFTALEQINSNQADIAIGPWFHLFHSLGEYQTQVLGEFHLILVASPDLLDTKRVNSISDITGYPNISITESQFNFDSERLGYATRSPQIKTLDCNTLKNLLLDGIGWGLLPYHLAEEELVNGTLHEIKLHDQEYEFKGEVRAYRRADKLHGPVAQAMWQLLEEQVIA